MYFCLFFSSVFLAQGDAGKEILLKSMSKSLLPKFSPRTFMVSGLMCKSLIHFEFSFVYGIIKWNYSTLPRNHFIRVYEIVQCYVWIGGTEFYFENRRD